MNYQSVAKIISEVIDLGKAEGIICNLTNLRKVIKWIPSKYNEYTKEEMITDLMCRRRFNDNLIWRYDCGSKSEGYHNRGRTYTLVCRQEADYLICEYEWNDVKVYRLEER